MNPFVCYHEAAHAVCAWYLGFDVHQIQVLSDQRFFRHQWLRDRFGRELTRGVGHTEYRRNQFIGADRYAQNGARVERAFCKRRIAVIAAGPVDTAIRSGQSLSWAYTFGGSDDRDLLIKIRAWGAVDQKTMGKIVEQTALFLFAMPGTKAVERVAERLIAVGRVTGSQLNYLCREVFKTPCLYDPTGSVGPKGYIDSCKLLEPQINRRALSPP